MHLQRTLLMAETQIEDDDSPLHLSNDLAQKPTDVPLQCKICQAPAIHSNFGIITCFACRTFFRRNAEKGQDHFKCDFDNACEVNLNNRHICSACRLKKCFADGMQVDLIRCARSRKNIKRSKKVTGNKSTFTTTSNILFPILNPSQTDRFTLSPEQWSQISSLLRSYDEHGGITLGRRFRAEQDSLPLKMRYKVPSVTEILTSMATSIHHVFNKNKDDLVLCPHDQPTLLRRRMKYASGWGSIFVLHQTKLLHDPLLLKAIESLFGTNIVTLVQTAANHFDQDTVFLKLILAALAFSTTDPTAFTNVNAEIWTDIKAVARTHDVYIELAWKYMVYKHGYQHAALRFVQLLRSLFLSHGIVADLQTREEYRNLIDNAIKAAEKSLVIYNS